VLIVIFAGGGDGDSMFLRNIGVFLQMHTTLNPEDQYRQTKVVIVGYTYNWEKGRQEMHKEFPRKIVLEICHLEGEGH
jgi:hypothetical protein